ncbi:fused MFS/spermidine synthase [Methylocapsa sp. S129]|uniref:fused MFS/spermidine synthase n=1 Tax=Methylocapsa sp. S129 TaxID=1641869 RepID=UPI00131B6FBF|nr:fused MFS/spermidine synthase [Methylocapsa sp. S129]
MAEVAGGRTMGISLLVGVCAFFQGFLSMGFQLVATRLLAPFFGSTLFVWSFVISTFLAAFSIGAIVGGLFSQLAARRLMTNLVALVAIGLAGYLVTATQGHVILQSIDASFDNSFLALGLSCFALFFFPVVCLSALLPIFTEALMSSGFRGGMSTGVVYGISTLGNITGVMVTAFVLIPSFPTSTILQGWTAAAAICFALFIGLIGRAAPHMAAQRGSSNS